MLKKSLTYLIISILIVLCKSYIALGLAYFHYAYKEFVSVGAPFLQQLGFGAQLQNILLLVLFPAILVGIPASIYYALTRKQMPYFMETTWSIWIVIVLCHILIP